jgi:hypothetical protein
MPSLRDSTLLSLPEPGTSVPGSYCAVPAGLVAVLPVNLVMEFSSSRAPYTVGEDEKAVLAVEVL